MGTSLNTFINIFNSQLDIGGRPVQLEKIVIPIIQRDYAQGRLDEDVTRIRTRFLNSLHQAITTQPMTLDFIYGDIRNGVMTPLDGQQRLTALFLLHWYACKKEKIEPEKYSFLRKFSYQTRYSARDFCAFLIDFEPTFTKLLSDEIVDQAWFPLDWLKDPTIRSMLVVLDDIDKVFGETTNIWTKLESNAISFYFLPIEDMELSDELYIKMNSRGKPLTQFEHFKAELERELTEIDPSLAKRIIRKIDIDWTDLLWTYRGDDHIIDDEFLRYFRFICDILCYQAGQSPSGKSTNEFDLLAEYFSKNSKDVNQNVHLLESYFDCWTNLPDNHTPHSLTHHFFSREHHPDKVRVERYSLDIFHDCLSNYADVLGDGRRNFPLGRIIQLYAFVTYLQNIDTITEDQFRRRLRIINNLVLNSDDDISDSEQRRSGNRMPQILQQTEAIVTTGEIDLTINKTFNANQLDEEIMKIDWVKNNPHKAEALYKLEDHGLLRGQIGIVGLENPEHFERFHSLFSCNRDLISRALLSIDNYGQNEISNRILLGSSKIAASWISLFHKSGNSGYNRTKGTLKDLLSRYETFSDEILSQMAEDYIHQCNEQSLFDWKYYFIKYDEFRPRSYGKYWWSNFNEKPYELFVLQTAKHVTVNSYQPFLKILYPDDISRDHLGDRAIKENKYIRCQNSAFVIYDIETDDEMQQIIIAQDEYGIDVEDRIKKMRRLSIELLF